MELICHPTSNLPVTRARSTVLLASRKSIVEAGLGAKYEALLQPTARHLLDKAVGGEWLPVTVATAHYHACDALHLDPVTASDLGRATNAQMKGTLYGTFTRVFQEAGGGPWNVLAQAQKFWERGYDGGGVHVWKVGPKEARVDFSACSLCSIPYYRHVLRGLTLGLIELVCKKAYMNPKSDSHEGMSTIYQWA